MTSSATNALGPINMIPTRGPVLPRRLAPVLPTTYSSRFLHSTKACLVGKHLGSPYHAFVHCKGFPPAASLRTRALVSVPFSGLGLSSPLRITGLVSHYLTNNLIRRRPIHTHRSFDGKCIPASIHYPVLASVSQGYSRHKGRLTTCY